MAEPQLTILPGVQVDRRISPDCLEAAKFDLSAVEDASALETLVQAMQPEIVLHKEVHLNRTTYRLAVKWVRP